MKIGLVCAGAMSSRKTENPQARRWSQLNGLRVVPSSQRIILALLFVLGCQVALLAQAPTLSSISPNSAAAGSPAFTLSLTGTNFNPASQVQWNGSARPTTAISSTQLTAAIAASDVASPGVAQITVFNPTSGLTSNPQPFSILAAGPPPPSTPPTLTSVGPPIAAQGSQHLQLTLRGTNFRAAASVVISPPLASVNLSGAKQQAGDIVVENISQVSSSLLIVVISVGPGAAPGLRAVDVVNTDSTNTGSQSGFGSGTSKPFNVTPANSLAAPLGVPTIAITQPRDGRVIAQGDEFLGEALLAGTGTGIVTGEWVWDGAVSEQFAVTMAGGERIVLRTQRSLPTLSLGLHSLELRTTAPNLVASRPIQVIINPGDWQSMRLLRPVPGAVFAASKPPLLQWLPVGGASFYQVGFSERPYFNSIKSWHDVTDSEWRVPQQVWFDLTAGDLYWTVRVVEASGVTRKPLPMRRITKYPVKALAAKPETRGGPVDPDQEQTPSSTNEAIPAQSNESPQQSQPAFSTWNRPTRAASYCGP